MFAFRRAGYGSISGHIGLLGAIGAIGGAALLMPACSSAAGDGARSSTSAVSDGLVNSCTSPAGCITAKRVQVQTTHIGYGQTVGPIAYADPPEYFALKFNAVTGDNVDIVVSAQNGEAYAWLTDSEFGILQFSSGAADADGGADAHITATIPSDGSMKHYIVFRERHLNPATFTITLNGPPPLTYQSTRVQQSDIDNGVYNADQLFAFGHVMFGNTFTVDEGLGNALTPPLAGPNPRPNARAIHNGKFGGPDATRCTQCHGVGGSDGAGTLAQNLLQDGDGVNMSSVLLRNPPAIIGEGYIQQLGIEMTADLQAQLAAAEAAGSDDAGAQTVPLSSKGVSFGSVTINADGSRDFSALQGVDADLVVKPLGWKGRTAAIRRFVEGGFQVHLGMASQALIAQNCGQKPIPNVVGDGPDCTDPDNDGVRDEILESQLTAMALYPALLQAPIRVPAATPQGQARAANGEQLFDQVGCPSCHVQRLVLNSPIHDEAPDLSGGPPFVVDLTVNGKLPRLHSCGDGTVDVELFSDLKRHDMGASLADPHDSFGVIAPNLFMTRPLWGVGVTAPYLHDGRAPDLQTAIALHDGEAATVRDAFLALDQDSQAQVVEFLQTLSRDPQHTDD